MGYFQIVTIHRKINPTLIYLHFMYPPKTNVSSVIPQKTSRYFSYNHGSHFFEKGIFLSSYSLWVTFILWLFVIKLIFSIVKPKNKKENMRGTLCTVLPGRFAIPKTDIVLVFRTSRYMGWFICVHFFGNTLYSLTQKMVTFCCHFVLIPKK